MLEGREPREGHRRDPVWRRRHGTRRGGELLGEAEDIGDGLPLARVPELYVRRRAQIEVGYQLGGGLDVVAVTAQVGGHASSSGSAPTRPANTVGTPGQAEASSLVGMVSVSARSTPRVAASSRKRLRTAW
jgi:hypothetical protein